MPKLYQPEFLFHQGSFQSGLGLLVGDDGIIESILPTVAGDAQYEVVRLPKQALLPGLVNAHSHTFQRLIRGRSENRGANGDDFWTWRNTMYAAALALSQEDLYDVARMAFLEMALTGITAVGEFHYVHRTPRGEAYPDPNLLSKTVIAAAQSVGLRICLLRVAYARAGFNLPPNPGQIRFYESTEEYLANVAELLDTALTATVSVGVAPHSIRALTLDALKSVAAFAAERDIPIHMHTAEQTAEIAACELEHGLPPVRLLAKHGLLCDRLTLVHAIHTAADEVAALAEAQANICSCPTTERNLGDGIIDAEAAMRAGIGFCFGSDSQATIDLLEDARELDYHLRLQRQRRVLLDGIDGVGLSERLFASATIGGARSLGLKTGALEPGRPADFFTVDLNDPSIAGATSADLLPAIVFTLARTAVREVVVHGRAVIRDGTHAEQRQIVERYRVLSERLAPR